MEIFTLGEAKRRSRLKTKRACNGIHRKLKNADEIRITHPVVKCRLFDRKARDTVDLTEIKEKILSVLDGIAGVLNPGVEPGYYYYENAGVSKADRKAITEQMQQIDALQPYIKTCNHGYGRIQKYLFCRFW